MKKFNSLLLALIMIGLVSSCTDSTVNSPQEINDVIRTLKWGGNPALDGLGITFEVDDITYGINADRNDYEELFPSDAHSVEVKADLIVTGNSIIRSFNVRLPEAEIVNIEAINN